jgi:hypothetical protein
MECYHVDQQPANTCGMGGFGVVDPVTLAWRYWVRLDPADIPKAMWAEVSPDGTLVWTSSGNDLLAYSSKIPSVDVRKSRGKVSIFGDGKIFLTVTAADARVSNTTVDKLARLWAQRLRTILPKATPVKH